MQAVLSAFEAPILLLQSGHGRPLSYHAYQDPFPVAMFCLGAAAIIAVLWLLAELLE